jgi:hypothetical protein
MVTNPDDDVPRPEVAINPPEVAINRPHIVAEVTACLEAYERALVGNEVEALVDAFWASPLAVRYGIDECQYGHDEIAAYRRAAAIATPPRRVTRTSIVTYGDDVATADIEFVPDGTDDLGRQSQTWVRFEVGWRVTSAHVSWLGGRRTSGEPPRDT